MHAHTHKKQWKEADQCVVIEFKSRISKKQCQGILSYKLILVLVSTKSNKTYLKIYMKFQEAAVSFCFADVLRFVLTGPLCFERSAQPWDSNMVPASSSRIT